MKAIGFRCWKDRFAFVVLEATQERPIVVASKRWNSPANVSRPAFLAWVRQSVQEILDTYQPDAAAYKAAETTAKKQDLPRAEVEGVVQEAIIAHQLGLEPFVKRKQQIRADLQAFDGRAKYVDKALEPAGLGHLSADFREAALVALCHLPSEEEDD